MNSHKLDNSSNRLGRSIDESAADFAKQERDFPRDVLSQPFSPAAKLEIGRIKQSLTSGKTPDLSGLEGQLRREQNVINLQNLTRVLASSKLKPFGAGVFAEMAGN
jgi:hypothetical protein